MPLLRNLQTVTLLTNNSLITYKQLSVTAETVRVSGVGGSQTGVPLLRNRPPVASRCYLGQIDGIRRDPCGIWTPQGLWRTLGRQAGFSVTFRKNETFEKKVSFYRNGRRFRQKETFFLSKPSIFRRFRKGRVREKEGFEKEGFVSSKK